MILPAVKYATVRIVAPVVRDDFARTVRDDFAHTVRDISRQDHIFEFHKLQYQHVWKQTTKGE